MDDESLIYRASMALLAIIFLGAFANTTASAKEVPKLPIPTPTVTPIPTATITSSPTATRTPEPIPTITQTPTPTPDPVIEITAGYKVDAVVIWLGEIERINENESLDLDPVLVMAVMAAESGGNHNVVSSAGACGLMQVIPRHYHELSAYDICHSRVGNIYQGMYILRWALDYAESEGLSLNYGVAFYNCSVDGVMNDRCGTKGGIHYADNVLNFWYPRFELALEELR
jgi:hypothetical protein